MIVVVACPDVQPIMQDSVKIVDYQDIWSGILRRNFRVFITLSPGVVPGEQFAENNRQLVARRGIMSHARVCATAAVAPLRVNEESHVE